MLRNSSKNKSLINEIIEGNRLSIDQYLNLYEDTNLLELGFIANIIKNKFHSDKTSITFVIDRNINYTNICTCKCKFCAFHKDISSPEGYVLDYSTIKKKVKELTNINGTQILLQGGLNPKINLEYYINLLTALKKDFPGITIHAFSPPEISYISKLNNITPEALLIKFKKAGLNSIPGGGAEVLIDSVRQKLSPEKILSNEWLNIMETAHKINLPTTATLMAGSIETNKNIIEHLIKIRTLQDKTHGFTAFIPWSYQGDSPEINLKKHFSGQDYLKLIAISRIILDNIKNIQVSWPTQGIKIAQIALNFGANDFGGTMLEENVISSTGITINPSLINIIKAIKNIKKIPAQRTTNYEIIKYYL